MDVTICTPTIEAQMSALGDLIFHLAEVSRSSGCPDIELVVAGGHMTRSQYRSRGLRVRTVPSTRSAAAARNSAAACASGVFLAFLDDDVLPAADFGQRLAAVVRAIDTDDPVVGAVGLVRPARSVDRVDRAWEDAGFNRFFGLADLAPRLRWGCTANMVLRRTVFGNVGGFARTPVPVGGEDIDLGIRVTDDGRALLAAPELAVDHSPRSERGWQVALTKAWNYGRSEQWLAERHPAFRVRPRPLRRTGNLDADRLLERFGDGRRYEARRLATPAWSVSPTDMALAIEQ